VLEGAGFFRWVGDRLIQRAGGSGIRLFHLILAFSACLTLFLNNDGAILLGTPVVIGLVAKLKLPRRAAFDFLIGACLIASAASPPIGVSNMANLEAMSLVGISLTQHLRVVMLPALAGLAVCWGLLHLVFRRAIPQTVSGGIGEAPPPPTGVRPGRHALPPPPPGLRRPLAHPPPPPPPGRGHLSPPPPPPPVHPAPDRGFMWFAVGTVAFVRAGFFLASLYAVPTYLVALSGAVILLLANLQRRVVNTKAALWQAPWAVLGFAFGMDLVVFGLRSAGITSWAAHWMGPLIRTSPLALGVLPGLLATVVSSLLNNHPGLIIGSLTLLDMGALPNTILHVAYSGVVLGADLGALFTPIGTLASLIWFHILQQNGHRYGWWDYVKVTLMVIPLSFALALAVLLLIALLPGP